MSPEQHNFLVEIGFEVHQVDGADYFYELNAPFGVLRISKAVGNYPTGILFYDRDRRRSLASLELDNSVGSLVMLIELLSATVLRDYSQESKQILFEANSISLWVEGLVV